MAGLLTGPNCYGSGIKLPDGTEEIYQVLGVWNHDAAGAPEFGDDIRDTVVHEFCHSYVNAVVDRHAADLRACGAALFPARAGGDGQAGLRQLVDHGEGVVRAGVRRALIC